MPVKHSPPKIQAISQAKAQAVLTPTPRAPFYGTPAASQLRGHLERASLMEEEAPSRKEGRKGPRQSSSFSGVVGHFLGISRIALRGPGEYDTEEEEKYVEEEESDSFVPSPAPLGESQGTGGPNLVHSDQLASHQSEKSLLTIMQQVTQIMANLQAVSFSEGSRPPAFKTLSMKASQCFDWTQPSKFRSFIQAFQLILYNDKEKFSKDRKEALCST
ncbi:hypothetical protein O181_118542 [Austropuccinia psidii MF-1]|uniref:Uncharacterized protein n=1 Tax=Austropuccinia psidii MF-1 TaxID=1389203 RepID=A0A9Q3Q0H9_9BASI|nr:hypothetical protein [Austropuccinia psidii MF-1]